MLGIRIGGVLAGLACLAASTVFAAADPADYFKGKTINYIVATAPGGGYDTNGRLVAEYMQKYLPGATVVVRNMPGAGHLIGANAIYSAKPDGLTIGTFNTGLIYNQLIGLDGVKFDLTKMSWIGKAASEPRVFVIAAKSPIKTFKELLDSKQALPFATSGVGSASYVETKILTDVLRLPVKIIPGYNGSEDTMAMRRDEIVGIIGSRSSFEEFVKNGYGRFIAQIGGKEKDVPQLATMVTGANARAMVALIASQGEIARLTAGPPNIPKDVLEALRTAYRRALSDKDLQARAEKLGRPLDPAYGDEVLADIKEAFAQPPETIALLAKALDISQPILRAIGPLLEVQDKGAVIAFAGPDKQRILSKPSSSRTKITIAGKDAQRTDLKTGLTCDISYKSGGDNEPSTIECQ
jgi:tripartite-type tricarboxylate transporter receptor subunit TctC